MAELYTEVVKASVFRRGAEVLRRGRAQLEEGAQTITVYGLSTGASVDTARLFSQEGVFCSDLRFMPQFDDDSEDPKARELKDKIEELEKQIEVKELRILSESETTPFEIIDNCPTAELTRLKYRYLDLRRPELQKNMIFQ